jgi:hypothetical protein
LVITVPTAASVVFTLMLSTVTVMDSDMDPTGRTKFRDSLS